MLPASEPVTVLVDDALEPGRECKRLMQGRQALVRLDERLLGGILCQVEVVQDGIGVTVGHVLKTADQETIGVGVA